MVKIVKKVKKLNPEGEEENKTWKKNLEDKEYIRRRRSSI